MNALLSAIGQATRRTDELNTPELANWNTQEALAEAMIPIVGTLHRTRGDQQPLRAGQPAGERRQREQHQPGQEEAPMAVQVAQPPA